MSYPVPEVPGGQADGVAQGGDAAGMRGGRFSSLGGKLVLVLTLVGLIGSAAITLLLFGIITPSFSALEGRAVDAHVERTRAALAEYTSQVEGAVRDYGDWNDSYDYMANPSADFERESFSPLAMANLDVNGMAYIGNDRRIIIARWLDLATQADQPPMRAALEAAIARLDLARLLGNRSAASFYVRLGKDVVAVGVAKVRRSDGSGEPRGHVLMARRVTSGQISDLLQVKARILLEQSGDSEVVTRGEGQMRIAVPIMGADGHAVAAIAYNVPRDISALGNRMLMLAVGGTVCLLLLLLIVLRRMITRLVLRPLRRVENHMQVVRTSGSLGLLEDEEARADEIGSLGRSFNSMLRQLKDLREQLEVQSFALGRSESAVAVMHNVRNALNPISTILSKGLTQPPPVDAAMLDRAMAELAKDDLPAARRDKLLAFVRAAMEAEARDRAEQRQQLQIGREAMSHVLEIIGAQQQAAHERPQLAACDIADIISQNETIARHSGSSAIRFMVAEASGSVMANRVILSQVVGNLFSNAAEAIVAAGRQDGEITVSVEQAGTRTRILIRDNGEGFDPATGATLFQRGFSTRAHKSGGLGLHWCANSMTAMGGTLTLESAGKGSGAVAVLELASANAVDAAGQPVQDRSAA